MGHQRCSTVLASPSELFNAVITQGIPFSVGVFLNQSKNNKPLITALPDNSLFSGKKCRPQRSLIEVSSPNSRAHGP